MSVVVLLYLTFLAFQRGWNIDVSLICLLLKWLDFFVNKQQALAAKLCRFLLCSPSRLLYSISWIKIIATHLIFVAFKPF